MTTDHFPDVRKKVPAVWAQVERQVRGAAPREICIGWRLHGRTGNGLWRLDTADSRAILTAWVAEYCLRFGEGTHWIAERDA